MQLCLMIYLIYICFTDFQSFLTLKNVIHMYCIVKKIFAPSTYNFVNDTFLLFLMQFKCTFSSLLSWCQNDIYVMLEDL